MHQNKSSLNILAIDTSECYINIGLKWHGHFSFTSIKSHNHQDLLGAMLQDICESYDTPNVSDIDLLVCTKGPGKYIGTRLGIAATKGLAATTTIPYVLVSTFEPYIIDSFPAIVLIQKSKKHSIIQIHYTKSTRGDLLQCSFVQLSEIINKVSESTPNNTVSFYYRDSEIRHAIESPRIIPSHLLHSFCAYPERRYAINLIKYGEKKFYSSIISSNDEDAMYINDVYRAMD